MIDVHSHVVPEAINALGGRGGRWPRLVPGPRRGDVMVEGDVYRTVRPEAWDMDRRRADLEAAGVTGQVVSPMPHLLSYWAPPAEAAEYCRGVNAALADMVRPHAGYFHALGMVPLQDPDAAGALLAEVAALGLAGVQVGSSVNGVPVCDPAFVGVFAEAARLDLAVFVHAFQPPRTAHVEAAAASAVHFPVEIGQAVAGLVANGVLARLPDLRLCASHGGGTAAFAIARLQHAWSRSERLQELSPDGPVADLARAFYDTLVFAPEALAFLVRAVGDGQVVVGSDYPFLGLPVGWPLDEVAELRAAQRDAIRTANALAFLHGRTPPPGGREDP